MRYSNTCSLRSERRFERIPSIPSPGRELDDRFAEVRRLKGAIAAYEARLVRAVDGLADRGLDGRGMLRAQGKASDRIAARAAATATALGAMPRVEAALADGHITAEHADALVDAAEKVADHVSAADAEAALLGEVGEEAQLPPADVFAKRSRRWATAHTHDDGSAEHDRQRRNRSGAIFTDTTTGMERFTFDLDRESGVLARKVLLARERQLWRDDGGRDGDPSQMRTHEQRLADAFVELLTDGTGARAGCAPPHPKHQLNVTLDLAGLTDAGGTPLAALVVDGEPLPAAVLERISCTAGITPILFDGPGRPIWVGRDHRTATVAQWRALIARDRGCVGCGAAPERCQAHHIIPWWPHGPTDIDNLVLVCSRCHHDLHERGMRLRRVEHGWQFVPGDVLGRDGPEPVPRLVAVGP